MQAVAVTEFGGPPRLMELPKPEPAGEEVLVRLVAAGVNPFDRTIAQGWVQDRAPHTFPLVLGVDGAGVVEQVGEGVERLAIGQAVYGAFLHPPYGKGTYAQYVTVPEQAWIAPAPSSVALRHAAAAPTAGTAALALMQIAQLGKGQSVLIVGAGGGIGSFAVQLAANRGARVLATVTPQSRVRVGKLGADVCIDRTNEGVTERVAKLAPDGVDVLLDLASDAEAFAANLRLVRDGGHAVSTRYAADAAALSSPAIGVANLDLTGQHASKLLLEQLTAEIDSGRVRIDVQSEIPLDRAPTAMAHPHGGKTIITIEPEYEPGAQQPSAADHLARRTGSRQPGGR